MIRSRRLVAAGSAVLLYACGDSGGSTGGSGGSTSTTTTVTSTTTTGAGGGTGSGGSPTTVTSGGGGTMVHPGVLVDDGLIARYLIDESDTGQTPTELVDSAPLPLSAPIAYVPELAFTADAEGRRGLRFLSTQTFGRVAVPVDGTKFEAGIDGKHTVTIEVVADIIDVDGPSPLLFIGQSYWEPRVGLTSWQETLLAVNMNDSSWADFFVDVPATGRTVYHAVIDTNDVIDTERMRLYVDGAPLVPIDVDPPNLGTPIDLLAGNLMTIGNDNNAVNGRSPEGTIFYAAVYSIAFSDEQVLQNTALLLYDDDAPAL